MTTQGHNAPFSNDVTRIDSAAVGVTAVPGLGTATVEDLESSVEPSQARTISGMGSTATAHQSGSGHKRAPKGCSESTRVIVAFGPTSHYGIELRALVRSAQPSELSLELTRAVCGFRGPNRFGGRDVRPLGSMGTQGSSSNGDGEVIFPEVNHRKRKSRNEFPVQTDPV